MCNIEERLELIRNKKGFLCDMDGVLYHGNSLLPGVKEFVNWLHKEQKNFVFLTNSSERSPKELQQKLSRLGLDVSEEHFYTSALATAKFLKEQSPNCTAFVIGSPGLYNALYDVGIAVNDVNPDYVIVSETQTGYNYNMIIKAVELVNKGARLIGTNPDLTYPTEVGMVPSTKALIAPIQLATGKVPYYIGKPNPLMMRAGLDKLKCHSGEAVMIGDNMSTDIIAGIETGLFTVLVLSGVSNLETIKEYAYRPSVVINSVGNIVK